jgi:SAM-dependent methyltransferase
MSSANMFTLQCILTMFAEDIGLLPQEYFTTLLYDGARHRDVEKRLAELFRLMATRDVPGVRAVPHFNGGLFTNPVTLPLGEAQLAALTKASEANWKYVDPHIFGSVFQGIMNDAERHKSGAHYTAHEDIMRVVGPTIVEPWRKRIRGATTLTELLEVRKDLLAFRVLDPACGSGNFLYVSFRELYKLDTELLARIRAFPSTAGGATKIAWGSGIQTARFFGIDINPFAVELAKVTLNIAKKIAFDERRETAADLFGQVEIDLDPSLPLDNLDKNIVCADALFSEWPEVNAIVGNPPFLGDRKIRSELGVTYMKRIQSSFGVDGIVDLCCYWFRRAHERLPFGGRAGLVGTSGIRVGKAREAALDYVVDNGGTITNAVSSRLWPGEAALNVSMVNWVKGSQEGPHQLVVDDDVFELPKIATHLQLQTDLSSTVALAANTGGITMGVTFGHEAFRASGPGEMLAHISVNEPYVRPVATGSDILTGGLQRDPDWCLFLCDYGDEASAKKAAKPAYEHLARHVLPGIKKRAESGQDTEHYARWLKTWWQPLWPRTEFFHSSRNLRRFIVCSKVVARSTFVFLSAKFVPNDTLQIFALDDDYSFGLLQSAPHWAWTRVKGGKVRADFRYTNDVWRTFAWPQEATEAEVVAVAAAGRDLRRVRDELMRENGLSLRALYQAAEVGGPHPLKDAQAALDESVRRAYSMPAGAEATEFLLEMNKLVAEDEADGRPVQGPGLPRGLDPKDPRWTSDDCIQPPKS